MTSELKDLMSVVRSLRKKKFPDLPENLVNEILEIEAEHLDDRATARADIMKAIERHLEDK